jgi:hypothetical protein
MKSADRKMSAPEDGATKRAWQRPVLDRLPMAATSSGNANNRTEATFQNSRFPS